MFCRGKSEIDGSIKFLLTSIKMFDRGRITYHIENIVDQWNRIFFLSFIGAIILGARLLRGAGGFFLLIVFFITGTHFMSHDSWKQSSTVCLSLLRSITGKLWIIAKATQVFKQLKRKKENKLFLSLDVFIKSFSIVFYRNISLEAYFRS